jgi:hypothetical protein
MSRTHCRRSHHAPNPHRTCRGLCSLAHRRAIRPLVPEQALAVWELLNELADRIWARYEIALVELIGADLEPERDPNQPDLFDPDDSTPF